jgi:type VI secretion system protein VasD
MIATEGCSTTAAVQVAGAAVNVALEATGLKQKSAEDKPAAFDVPLSVSTGKELNITSDGQSLSLVVRIYQLRTPQSFKTLTYTDANSQDGGKDILGNDLIAYKEVTVVPNKTYDLKQKVPGDGTTIGIIGLFRAPAGDRWKIAFDAQGSRDTGITVGAHACALTAGKGKLSAEISSESDRSLVGVRCSG